MSKFAEINQRFLQLYEEKYNLVGLEAATYWKPQRPSINRHVCIYFLLATEEEKLLFQEKHIESCMANYRGIISENSKLSGLVYEFYALSLEEVESKHGGAIHHAITPKRW